jgi:hypothetical protein
MINVEQFIHFNYLSLQYDQNIVCPPTLQTKNITLSEVKIKKKYKYFAFDIQNLNTLLCFSDLETVKFCNIPNESYLVSHRNFDWWTPTDDFIDFDRKTFEEISSQTGTHNVLFPVALKYEGLARGSDSDHSFSSRHMFKIKTKIDLDSIKKELNRNFEFSKNRCYFVMIDKEYNIKKVCYDINTKNEFLSNPLGVFQLHK